jgi:hypothetical protein
MRTELIRWAKFITVVLPLISTAAIVVFFVLFHRPLRQILEQFNCRGVLRFRLGPLEIEKRGHGKSARSHRRKRK